jgi:uncharacterized membrane protein
MVKTTRFVLAFLFAFVFVIGLGSADVNITLLSPSIVNHSVGSVNLILNLFNTNETFSATGLSLVGKATVDGIVRTITFSGIPPILSNETGLNVSGNFDLPAHKTGPITLSIQGNSTINGTVESMDFSSSPITINPSSSIQILTTSINEGSNQKVRVKNTGNQLLTNIELIIANSSLFGFVVDSPKASLVAGAETEFIVNVSSLTTSTSTMGVIDHVINVTSNSAVDSGIISIERNYCRYGEVGGNSILITDVEDDDDFEWEPLMDVEVEVEVENNGDSSERVIVKLGLYDLTEGEFVDFVDGEDELEETIRISDGDEEVVTFNFKLPATIDPNNEYRLYVKAYESGEEDTKCNSWVEDVEVDSDYEVLMDDLDMPQILICGETNTISLRLHNLELGDDELMRVNLYSQELGLNIYSEEFELDEGDDEYLTLSFIVPENKESKSYRITFYAQYDYKESSDTFRESENLGSYTLTVDGDKCRPSAVPSISASLAEDTETIVGKDLKIEVTITNPSDAPTTDFIIALDDYTSWASSATLDQTTFSLVAGESKTITATFNPTKGGSQEFVVKAIYSGRVEEQRVTVSIDEKTTWLSRIADSMGIEANATFWLTIAIFIVLILIIVVLLVKFINSSKE